MLRERFVTSGIPPIRLDTRVNSGPPLSPREYARTLAAKTALVLSQVYQQEETDEVTRGQIDAIVIGSTGSIEVSMDVVRAIRGARLAYPSVLTIHQIDDDGFRETCYKQNEEGIELLRVASYALTLPPGEGIEQGKPSYINLSAKMDASGKHDFNHWTLSRLGRINS